MKKILSIFLVILSVCMVFSSVFAVTVEEPKNVSEIGPDRLKKALENSWATIATLIQILSAACFVFAGLRYMFASADQKADIKRGMIHLFVGAFIVFGATTIIRMVASAAEKVID